MKEGNNKSGRPGKTGKPGKFQKPGRPNKSSNPGRPNKSSNPGRPNKSPKQGKLQMKQHSKSQQKTNIQNRNAKFFDQVVDYFPRDGDEEGMKFNKAPVIKDTAKKPKDQGNKTFNNKRPRDSSEKKETKKRSIYQDYESDDEEDVEELTKKVKGDPDLEDTYEEGLLGMSKGFADYFMNKKNSFKTLSKMGNFNYDEGSIVLTAIADKGPNEKYLVVNLPRNKKGYISFNDVGRGKENLVGKFEIGEFVLAAVVASNEKKVQLSTKPEIINRDLKIQNIQPRQVIVGYLRDQEDYGYSVDFCTEDRLTGFLYTPAVEGLELVLNRPYMFIINGKNETTNVLDCQIIHPQLSFGTEPLNYRQIAKEVEESGLDLQRLADAGNLVEAIVKKKLENGLLVSFLGVFYGFIFQDHLANPLEEYKVNDKILSRIIATNFEAKQIHLSDLAFHISLDIYNAGVPIGSKFKQALVKEKLYGGAYFLEMNTESLETDKPVKDMNSGSIVKGFLHKTHVTSPNDDDDDEEETKEAETFEPEETVQRPVYVKEYNYFEHYVIATMREDAVAMLKSSWKGLQAGDILTGVITKIIEGGPQLVKVIVSIAPGVTGVVNYTHISDLPSKASLKNIKEKKQVKVRILTVDPENKKLYLTMKPSLVSEEIQPLTNYVETQQGTQYTGFISGSSEKGYLVEFFNGVRGFLPYSDIESNGSNKDDLVVGQVVRVYVKFTDISNQKIGLTLSSKVLKHIKAAEGRWTNITDQNPKSGNLAESSIAEGDVYEYKILRKKSASNEEYLYAKSCNGVLLEKGEYTPHIAILPKTHCSDFEAHNERVFEFYRLNEVTFQAKVLGFLPNNNVLISCKPSLIKQVLPKTINDVVEKQYYYGYVDACVQGGVRIKLSENTKGFLSSNKFPEAIQQGYIDHFPLDKSLHVKVTKVVPSENKLFLDLAHNKETIIQGENHSFFLDYLNEEFMVTGNDVSKNLNLWETHKIGNYVEATIKLVKDYGIIVTLNEKLAGLILKSNLKKNMEDYKPGQTLLCRVLDVDYEKNVVDLCEENLDKAKYNQKYKKRINYNREKIVKYGIWKRKNEVLSATVLLVKDMYIVGKLVKHPKVIVLIQCKGFNDFHMPHEQYERHSTVKFNSLNLEVFNPKTTPELNGVNGVTKANNTVVGEIVIPTKKEKEEAPVEKEADKSDSKIKQKLKEGAKVTGKVTKIVQNNIFVSLSKTIFGRIHKTQFDYDAMNKTSSFNNYNIGDEITCKIISIKKTDRLYLDLTARTAQVELPEEEFKPTDFIAESITDAHKGTKQLAIVKDASTTKVNPLYLEISNTVFAHVSLFDGILDPNAAQSANQVETLKKLEESYKPGDLIEVWIKKVKKTETDGHIKYNVEATLYDPSTVTSAPKNKNQVAFETTEKTGPHKIGDMVLCKIIQILPKKVKVRFAKNDVGFVDVTELFDEFYAHPHKKIAEKKNMMLPGRIIGFSVNENPSKSKKTETLISLRESVLNPANWQVMSPEGTTVQFKKKLGYQEEQGDLRSRIYKFGPSAIKENMLFVGYVNQTNDKGCFVKLSFNLTVRASLKDLSDIELKNPTPIFFPNRLVIGRVLTVRPDGKIDATLKERGVKYGYTHDDSKFKVGLIVKGEVTGHIKNAALVSIPGCKHGGLLQIQEVNTEGKSIEKALPIGTPVLAKIKHIEKNNNSLQFKLTCRIDEEELEDKTNIFNLIDEKSKEVQRAEQLYESIQDICKEYENFGNVSSINTELLENLKDQTQAEGENDKMEEEKGEEGEEEEQGEAQVEQEDDEEDEDEQLHSQKMMIDFGEDENEEEGNQQENEIKEDQSVISEEEELEQNVDLLLSNSKRLYERAQIFLGNKSGNKKKKEIHKMKLEAEIREREKKLLDEHEKELKTSDDYEKLLLKNPNSSYIWIQYVAFKFQKDGIEKARQLLERALRTIMFRNEDEKLNLWTAYINLEYNFGTEESLMKIFERAKTANNPKQIFIKLLDLYKRDGKWELVEELSKAMIKKHKNSSKAWVRHLEDMIGVMKHKNVSNIDLSPFISRAMQCLPKRKHLKILSHHGILLFQAGEQEKGRTVFEAIVTNYPKRTDIWSIYADMETKYGDKESYRNLMERCLTLSLNPKKIKFFFKRYLQYEMEHGNAERIEYVKQKAREYVERQMEQDGQAGEEGGEDGEHKLE